MRHAAFGVGFGDEIRSFLHFIDCVAHRDADACVFDHAQVVLVIADGHDIFGINIQQRSQFGQGAGFTGIFVQHFQEMRFAADNHIILVELRWNCRNQDIQQFGLVDEHDFCEQFIFRQFSQ